jgi:hypothetical protein
MKTDFPVLSRNNYQHLARNAYALPITRLLYRIGANDPTMIFSSQSGAVNFAEWRKLFDIAERARRFGRGVGRYPRKARTYIGGYRLWRVYKNGDVLVGCQRVPYWEIVRTMFAIDAKTAL